MRFRRGAQDVAFRDDAVGGNAVGNIIIDHCSASWGLDENMSIYRHVYNRDETGHGLKLPTVNITIQNSIFSEALDTYNHAFGATIGGHNSMFCRNLFASNISRNSSVGMDGDFNFVNNVVFNWWNRSVDDPKLNFGASYSNGYYHYSGDGEYTNLPFSDQLKNNGRKTIGFSLSIPLFNRFQVRNSVRSARINIRNRELMMENTKKVLYKEIQQAYYNATAAQEKYTASDKSVLASKEAFSYAEDRYVAGKSTVFEYSEAKTKYAQSLSEQAQAKYDFIFRTKILDFYNGTPITL